jgi:hypothetical protein
MALPFCIFAQDKLTYLQVGSAMQFPKKIEIN